MIILPEYVYADPGEEITVEGKLLNTGNTWLHFITLNLSGLPFEYEIIPEKFDHLEIFWNWTTMKRIPKKFFIKIKIPENASRSYAVKVFAQEHFTALKVWNYSYFILKIRPRPNVTVKDLIFPTEVFEGEPFLIKVVLENSGLANATANLTISLPSDWSVDEKVKSVKLGPLSNATVIFNVTPTTTVGNFSIILTYPYKKKLISIKKFGPVLVPLTVPEVKPEFKIPLKLIMLAVALILAFILFFKHYRIRLVRKKPERFKRTKKKGSADLV